MKHDSTRWQIWLHFNGALEISETDFSDYLRNLEDYENLWLVVKSKQGAGSSLCSPNRVKKVRTGRVQKN